MENFEIVQSNLIQRASSSMKWQVCCIGLSLALLISPRPAFGQDTSGSLNKFLEKQGYAEIDLSENTLKQFEVDVSLNGTPLLLLVDTGASHTFLSRKRLTELGFDLEKTSLEVSGIGQKQFAYSTEIDDLVIGSASTGPMSIYAVDLSTMRDLLRESGSRVPDGLLGSDFLTRWSAVLEVKQSRLFLRIQ